ncbi:metal-dependent hydrolase [Eubacterium sp. An11]|uniref:M48 family metallopeptidase n=1 Tax=Eubacterium sp. An11 TaxID=1965542 RepID=UPI000B558D87|nr:M48 family metallopeptidase [Eubacterium sp. An11]OUQ67345.1 metal-dependent hydrolase [Eubacterium sp. An11]
MMQEYILSYNRRETDGVIEKIPVQIIRSSRKSIGLQVKLSGEVLARIPVRLPDRELAQFLEKHREWIWKKVKQAAREARTQKTTGAVPVKNLTGEELEKIKEKFVRRVEYYSREMGVTVGRITIRNQKTRWGSCSSKGNLNFNYQLYYLPDALFDYVVVHELAHRRHMNHSPEFWKEVEKYFPDYRECRAELKKIKMI